MPISFDEMSRRLDYHNPADDPHIEKKKQSCAAIRSAVREAADRIGIEAPPGREQSLAITKLEEAVMWALAAIWRPAAKSQRQE